MVHYVAKPVSRKDLRETAIKIRKNFGLEKTENFPVKLLLEYVLPLVDDKFDFEILTKEEMPDGIEAITYPDESYMQIREDVYIALMNDDCRARFTIMHEFGHYLLHEEGNMSYARSNEVNKVKAFIDPEWQASAFAGEMLMPYDLVKGMSGVEEVMKKCKVSRTAATYQLNKYELL